MDISPSPASLQHAVNWIFVQGDLAEPSTATTVVEKCIAQYGKIDGLLNVAGVTDNSSSADSVTDAMWDRCISINLTAPVKLIQATLPWMRKQQRGSIVNVASKAATSGAIAGIAFTASKHGLVGATKNIAWRFKDENIRCNAICPGGVATNILASVTTKYDLDAAATMTPVHNLHHVDMNDSNICQPEDVANLLLFLVSDASSQISGAIIPIDQAWSTI